MQQPDSLWRDAIGRMLSEGHGDLEPPDPAPLISDLQRGSWIRHPDARMLYHRSAGRILLYCSGEGFDLTDSAENLERVQTLCTQWEWPAVLIRDCLADADLRQCLLTLAARGAIYSDEN